MYAVNLELIVLNVLVCKRKEVLAVAKMDYILSAKKTTWCHFRFFIDEALKKPVPNGAGLGVDYLDNPKYVFPMDKAKL